MNQNSQATLSRLLTILTLLLMCCSVQSATQQQKITTLALGTSDLSAYGAHYDTRVGYFNEIVNSVFENVNGAVDIKYYPHARTVRLLEKKRLDGAFPLRKFEVSNSPFLYSKALPGAEVGILKLTAPNNAPSTQTTIGVLRGESLPENIKNSKAFKIVYGNNHHNLFGMLLLRRIDGIVIDRFSASDLVIREFPQLIGSVFFDEHYSFSSPFYFAVSKQVPNAQQIIDTFNQALTKLENSGAITKILSKYGIYQSVLRDSNKPQLVIAAPDINAIDFAKQKSKVYQQLHPDVEIVWRIYEENVLRRRVHGNFALGKSEYDIILVGPFELQNWLHYNWFEPLDNLPDNYDFSDLLTPVKAAVTANNGLFGLPFVGETTVMFYRTDLLKKAKATLPDNLTYQNIVPLLNRVHDNKHGVSGLGLRTRAGWGQNMALISMFVNTYGGQWIDESGKTNVTTPQWIKAVKQYIRLLKSYGPPTLNDLGWQQNQQLFAQGKLAFFIDASSLATYFSEHKTSKVYDTYAITDVPTMVTSEGARWFWSWNFAIPTSSLHKEVAKDFIIWITQKDRLSEQNNLTEGTILPSGVRHSSYQEGGHLHHYDFAQLEYALLNSTKPPMFDSTVGAQYAETAFFPTIGYHVGREIHRALMGEISVERALLNAQNKIDEIVLTIPDNVKD